MAFLGKVIRSCSVINLNGILYITGCLFNKVAGASYGALLFLYAEKRRMGGMKEKLGKRK